MKKGICYTLLALGIAVLLAAGLLVPDTAQWKALQGVCIGVGAQLFGLSVSRLFMLRYEKRHPEESRAAEVELRDERNATIRNKAKAKSADSLQWVIMAMAYVAILAGAPLGVTLGIVAVLPRETGLEV